MTQTEQRIAMRKEAWRAWLAGIQSEPLTYCPSFPVVARRWNEWWAFRADRPLIVTQVGRTSNIGWDKAFDLLDRPRDWIRVRRRQVEQTHYTRGCACFISTDRRRHATPGRLPKTPT